jgi:DNA-binding CsgD family transcriptional regulator/tetratricopeptide (TPR) repeat protein
VSVVRSRPNGRQPVQILLSEARTLHGVLVGRAGLSPVMVGRSVELDRLAGLVGVRPVPSVALVSGEAGIGKTRLVQELAKRLPAGTLVLAGQADPGTVGRPMELFLDAVDTALAETTAADPAVRGEPTDDAERSAELLTVVRDPDRSSDERVRAGVELVRRLGAGVTTVVVFEDLHWADSESVAVFERLAEPDRDAGADQAGSGLLLVGTYRPDGLSRRQPAAEALPRLDRRHTVTHVHLDRLSPAEVSDFLAAVTDKEPSFRAVDVLHTRTGGNPFFLEELVGASDSAAHGESDVPLPWTVAELVRAEIDDLPPDVRTMLSAAAVLGRRVGFDLLAAVTGASEADLIARLRVAVECGLLVESDPDVFGFHHELAREAIEGGLLGRERRRLHEAALAALRATGSRDHVAVAHHARGAGRFDDMVDEARLGARSSLAHGSSYQALQLAESGLAEAPDDLELLALATRAAWLAGLLGEAEDHATRWLSAARLADDVSAESEALAYRTRVGFERGDREAMVTHTAALVGLIDRLPTDEERAHAMAAVAQSNMLRDQAEATYEWADKALALAEARGLTSVRLAAMVEKGSMMMSEPARADEARELLEAAARDAERTGEHVLAARAINNLVWHARRWSEADEVRDLIARMHAHTEAAGFDTGSELDVAAIEAQLAGAEGDLDGAIARLDDAGRSGARRAGWTVPAWLAIFRAGLALEAGDTDDAVRFTELAKPVTTRTASAIIGLDLNLALRCGDLDAARSRLAELLVVADADEHASASQAHDLLAAGLPAGLTADELRPLVDRVGHYAGHRIAPDSGWRHLLDAQLAEAAGDVDEAIVRYGDAARTLGVKADLLAGFRGITHVGAAANLVRADRLDEARAHAAEARRILARWRGWRVAALRAVERRLGLGDTPAGPEALTPREREVVALLAEGLTNAQLAERLYISPRTAAVHVSNVLTKLGMSSRTEVAAWAVRTGATAG